MVGKDGQSLRQTLETVSKFTGSNPEELDNPHEFPMFYGELWGVFLNLDAYRANNGFSMMSISYAEIESYCRLTKNRLTEFELSLLKRLDALSLNAAFKPKKG